MSSFIFVVAAGCDDADSTGRMHTDGGSPINNPNADGFVSPEDDSAFDQDAFFIQDPPVMYCGLDGGGFAPPPLPGGTLACPDDKNLQGCPCTAEGMTAPCWPGARKNRNLGICKDGMTTCTQLTETNLSWGACVGAVLPLPNATSGADACDCFSHGFWQVDNLTPCGAGASATTVTSMYSSAPPATDGGMPDCTNMMPAAGSTWSTDEVTVDCAGHFTLCYTLKAGNGAMPMASDCTVAQVCTQADYTQVNVPQTFPPLKSFISSPSVSACAMAFYATGGYGEMSVQGVSLTCDQIPQHVFQTVTYCAQGQAGCVSGGGGGF